MRWCSPLAPVPEGPKETMDYGVAVKLIEAAQRAGTRRYVIVSSMGADPDQPNMTASARSWFRAP